MTEQLLSDNVGIFNIGSFKTKIGYANKEAPEEVFKSVVGYLKCVYYGCGQAIRDTYVGKYFIHNCYSMNLKYPVQRGLVSDRDNFDYIVHYKSPVLLTESINYTKTTRKNLCMTMFEGFNCPYFCLVSQPVLSLMSTGQSTGYCVECGDGITQFVPIYEGS
ncbi:actin, putative [Entamoeba invadens IP1]|uniref:Actin, putative n=1 Tax=Entamoeba invadens IP1 TaxID=370355 RepID=L7FNK8_ENTIV|nr:actin, putative [Entamoeba invadens IP1]ELP88580.1 actin, putative [Entamoeba invadens IP1]|eukprot:XP_004255351.1 actin, putative [Entamoeba invadens IP1]